MTLAGLLPPDFGPLLSGLLVLVSFGTSLITAAFGIGGGAVLLALLAALMPPAALIPVHGAVQFGSNVFRAALMAGHIRRAVVPMFALGAAAGAALGGVIAIDLPPALMQAGVGAFILWSVLARPPRWLAGMPVLTGAVTSFLAMFFGATGPFVANYVKALKLERHAHVATHAAMMTLQHLLKVAVFGLLGFAFGPWLPLTLAMIVSGFLGTLAGRAVLGRMSDHGFRRALDVLLVLIALRLIWTGLSDL